MIMDHDDDDNADVDLDFDDDRRWLEILLGDAMSGCGLPSPCHRWCADAEFDSWTKKNYGFLAS